MPAKNIVKEFAPESYYHIYNRGVAKQKIFLDDQDYKTFLSYLKLYLILSNLQGPTLKVSPSRQLKNYFDQVKLLAYCLLPNHFHLFVFQKELNNITDFMRSLATKYSIYFNKKYRRVGPVFQGNYKAVMVKTENQFIYLSKYIHRNPLPLPTRLDLEGYKYSSYQNYLGKFTQTWLDKSEILSYFSKQNPQKSYQQFVEEIDERDLLMIKDILLDFEN
ncbi:MAG: transposase [Patescibacteria group bacterium]|nr:transposase [Patescibacteria group bacterium]